MYPQHIQNGLNFSHGLLIFLVLASILLSETGQIGGFQTLSGEVQSMIQQRHFRCSAEAFMNAGIQCCLVLNYNWYASLIEWIIICDVFSLIISPVSEGSGDVMVLRRSRPPPAMVLTR